MNTPGMYPKCQVDSFLGVGIEGSTVVSNKSMAENVTIAC